MNSCCFQYLHVYLFIYNPILISPHTYSQTIYPRMHSQQKPPNPSKYNHHMLQNLLTTKIGNQFSKIGLPRCLYADKSLLSIINFVFKLKFVSQCNIGNIYELEQDKQAIDIDSCSNVVFFIYPNPQTITVIGSMVHKNQAKFIKKNYHLFMVPSSNYLCDEALQTLNLSDRVHVTGFNFDFIPMSADLFSLEFCKQLDVLEENQYIVESLLRMSNITGKFRACFGLGEQSSTCLRTLEQEQDEIPEIGELEPEDYLIMLDRNIDYVTPMLTAFSYEGLLDLFFGIHYNQIQVPGHLLDSKQRLQTFILYNPRDKHYETISKMYILQVPEYLRQQSQQLSTLIKQQKQSAKSLEDLNLINETLMSTFILLQFHKSIVNFILTHINQCPFINTVTLESSIIQSCQRIEGEEFELLSVFYPFEQVLKLEVLASQVSEFGNYYSRFQNRINASILQMYHPQNLITVRNMVKKGMIKSSKTAIKWKTICEKYDLLPDQPHQYTYIHIIYSCLLVRFVEMFLTDNLNTQTIGLLSPWSTQLGSFSQLKKGDRVYIYVVGGVTYPQVECFRILSQKLNINLTILTTEVSSGQKMIRKCF